MLIPVSVNFKNKFCLQSKNCRIFAPRLSDGVMAALQILVLPVQVRVLVGQPEKLGD